MINIEEMTIGQAKELANMFGAVAPAKHTGSELVGQKVIVRASSAGVHYGTLKSISGDTVTLGNARRLWYWQVEDKKGISLSDVADHGVSKSSKICAIVPEHIVLGACEVMTTSAAAQLIYRESFPSKPVSPVRFYETKEQAIADMQRCADEEAAAANSAA